MKTDENPNRDELPETFEIPEVEVLPFVASDDQEEDDIVDEEDYENIPVIHYDSSVKETPANPWKKWLIPAAVAAAITLVVGGAGAAAGAYLVSADHQQPVQNQEQPSPEPALPQGEPVAEEKPVSKATCTEHDWIPVYKTVHHDAVTHPVEHDATYGTETTYHTVCNICLESIDGISEQHTASTGHEGVTTNVPITNEIITKEAWTETVIDKPATDDLVLTAEKCSVCGELRDVEITDEAENES